MVARLPKSAMIGPTDVSGRPSIGLPRFSSSDRSNVIERPFKCHRVKCHRATVQIYRLKFIGAEATNRHKNFRNFPKCGKIRLL
jgi:hypothetical protein